MSNDLHQLRSQLAPVAKRARSLPWAKERPWRTETHVWMEGEAPVVDLHDLSLRLGVAVVDTLEELGPDLRCGEVRLITGRGRHTGGVSRLRDAVSGALREVAGRRGWEVRQDGPGRFHLVIDPELAASRQTSPLVWFLVVVLTAGLYATWAPLALIPPALAIVSWVRR